MKYYKRLIKKLRVYWFGETHCRVCGKKFKRRKKAHKCKSKKKGIMFAKPFPKEEVEKMKSVETDDILNKTGG